MPCAFWNVKRCPIRPTSTPTKRAWPWPVWTVAGSMGEDPACVYKTLVTQGSSKNYFVFVIPVAAELDLKGRCPQRGRKERGNDPCSRHQQGHRLCARRLQPGGHEKAVHAPCSTRVSSHRKKVYVSGGRIGTQVCCAPADLIRAARPPRQRSSSETGAKVRLWGKDG